MGEVVGVWFNGRWGRKTARRIWLRRTPTDWEVQARQGDSDQPSRCWGLPTEGLARALVEHLQEPAGDDLNDGWRDVTSLYVN
jgi:hypothetical protein